MEPSIHPTAIVDPKATIGEGCVIGPYCIIGPQVTLGKNCELKSHVNIDGLTTIGEGCTIWPFASIGTQTQDLKYDGGTPGVRIGKQTTIREYVTINAATYDGDFTKVGDHCHIMVLSHIAHDCVVGNEVIMANAATLAGHVVVEDQAIIGGLCGVHQFVRIGKLSIMGGCSKAVKDVAPFTTVDGNPLETRGLNLIGLKRHGFASEQINELKKVYKKLFDRDKSTRQSLEELETMDLPSHQARELISFFKESKRGVTR